MPFVHALRPSPTSRSLNCRRKPLAERKVEQVSIGCLWNRLKKFLKLPAQKSRSEPPSRIAQDVAQARDEWRASQSELNSGTPGFHRRDWRSDRHGASLWPLPARSTPALQRTVGTLEDHDIRRRAACRRDRRALCVRRTDGCGPSFRAYVEQFVVPIPRLGDIAGMDNLPATKSPASAKPSRSPAPSCATCPRTAQTQPHRTVLR